MIACDLNAVRDIIAEVGASCIMPRFGKLESHHVEMKGIDDPVSIADQEAEKILSEKLCAYLPSSIVFGEETYASDKSIVRYWDSDKPLWVIDPIDGTRNFIAGKREFATMVALTHKGKTLAAWIHDPNTNDTLMGERGSGVYLGSTKLSLAAHDKTVKTVGLVGSRIYKLLKDPSLIPQGATLPSIEIGSCASFDYPRLFSGSANFASSSKSKAGFLVYRHTSAWDHVPGMFLHEEVGGYCADWQGNPYNARNTMAGLIYASDKDEWNNIYNLFQGLIGYISEKTLIKKTAL